MTDDTPRRCLKSVGMTAFVTHLDLFAGSQENGDAAADMQALSGWTTHSCRQRMSTARRILAADRTRDALDLIIHSRLSDKVRDAARAAR